MENPYCPNLNICRLVTIEGFTGNESQRLGYIDKYCKTEDGKWKNCKRYITKKMINFCPDFVLPDTRLTTDEIIDAFDHRDSE